MEDSGPGYSWWIIAILLPAVVYSTLSLDPFWTLAAPLAITLLLIPRILKVEPPPFYLTLALLATFQPLGLGRLLMLDATFIDLMVVLLQVWFTYFFILSVTVQIRSWRRVPIGPRLTIFVAVLATVTTTAFLGISAFFVDRLLSTQLIIDNMTLMLQLSATFVGSIILGLSSDVLVRRWPSQYSKGANQGWVED